LGLWQGRALGGVWQVFQGVFVCPLGLQGLPFFVPLYMSKFCGAGVQDFRAVFGCVWFSGCRALPLLQGCGSKIFGQVFDYGLSNKCFEQIFEALFGQSKKVSNRILTEFFNRIQNFFNRIRTEYRNYSSGLFPRLALQDLCAAASGLSGSPGLRWSACQGSFILAPS
jgi:hypothetical protein